jgi:hypothetical protein
MIAWTAIRLGELRRVKHIHYLILVLGLGVAACSTSTTPMQSAQSVRPNPISAPSAAQGTPPANATADCSGVNSQAGGGTAYLNCLRRRETH